MYMHDYDCSSTLKKWRVYHTYLEAIMPNCPLQCTGELSGCILPTIHAFWIIVFVHTEIIICTHSHIKQQIWCSHSLMVNIMTDR